MIIFKRSISVSDDVTEYLKVYISIFNPINLISHRTRRQIFIFSVFNTWPSLYSLYKIIIEWNVTDKTYNLLTRSSISDKCCFLIVVHRIHYYIFVGARKGCNRCGNVKDSDINEHVCTIFKELVDLKENAVRFPVATDLIR